MGKISQQQILLFAFIGFVLMGMGLRAYRITQNDFIFFDEGYYLNDERRDYVDYVVRHKPRNFTEFVRLVYSDWQIALASGKPLWLFLTNLRVFFGGEKSWYCPRVLSAISGCLTLPVVYLFAKRYFNCQKTAVLSVILLAILPSHVFYSRLGLQEAFSTLCFLLGFYFYVFPRELNLRSFLSAVFFVLAYLTNYRLIILPVLIAVGEGFLSFHLKERFNFRKYVWHILTFGGLIILIAIMDKSQHMQVTVPWMMHQTNMAQQEPMEWYNFFSYPYFTFRLESIFLGTLFLGNLYYMWRRKWLALLPFVLSLAQMLIFSFAEEKGARYICVVLPFIAMAAAALAVALSQEHKGHLSRLLLSVFMVLTIGTLLMKSWIIARFKSDYRPAMEYMMREDRDVKLVTSQKWVMNLYTPALEHVRELPHRLHYLLSFYGHGFKYLVIDPQAYVSWTKGQVRFYPELEDYLGFVTSFVKPRKVFDHLNRVMLERFVFEHNENLKRSLDFLASDHKEFGTIRIYDIEECLRHILPLLRIKGQPGE